LQQSKFCTPSFETQPELPNHETQPELPNHETQPELPHHGKQHELLHHGTVTGIPFIMECNLDIVHPAWPATKRKHAGLQNGMLSAKKIVWFMLLSASVCSNGLAWPAGMALFSQPKRLCSASRNGSA
jgi:hypothetical protein